jgi:hypothetical protein
MSALAIYGVGRGGIHLRRPAPSGQEAAKRTTKNGPLNGPSNVCHETGGAWYGKSVWQRQKAPVGVKQKVFNTKQGDQKSK